MVICWEGKELSVSEEFLGLYALDKTNVESSIPSCWMFLFVFRYHLQRTEDNVMMAVVRWLDNNQALQQEFRGKSQRQVSPDFTAMH